MEVAEEEDEKNEEEEESAVVLVAKALRCNASCLQIITSESLTQAQRLHPQQLPPPKSPSLLQQHQQEQMAVSEEICSPTSSTRRLCMLKPFFLDSLFFFSLPVFNVFKFKCSTEYCFFHHVCMYRYVLFFTSVFGFVVVVVVYFIYYLHFPVCVCVLCLSCDPSLSPE